MIHATPMRSKFASESSVLSPILSPNSPSSLKLSTPLKPRICSLLPSSVMSPVEDLPLPRSPLHLSASFNQSAFLVQVTCTLPENSPSVDDLAVSTLSLLSPATELLSLGDCSDFHIGSLRDIGVDGTPLRTPFHPSFPPLSESPLLSDLSAFPLFDAKIGPTANCSTHVARPLRPKLHRESTMSLLDLSLESSTEDISEILLSPSIPKRKISNLRRFNACLSLKMVKKSALSSIPEGPSQQVPCSPRSVESPLQASRFGSRCPLGPRKQTTVSPAANPQEDDTLTFPDCATYSALSPSTDDSDFCSYESVDARSKSVRPTLIPGFIRNLPLFKLPTTPSSASPVSISPMTLSCSTTPLKSPFLIQRKEDSSSRWKSDSPGEYFLI